MEYVSTRISDPLIVGGIFTVLKPDLSASRSSSKGEAHDFPEIMHVTSGTHTVALNGKEYTVKAGQLVIYAPGTYHVSVAPSDATVSIISFETASDSLRPLYDRPITITDTQKAIFSEIIEIGIKCFRSREKPSALGGMIPREDAKELTLQRLKKQLEFFLIDIINSFAENGEEARSRKERNRKAEYSAAINFLRSNLSRQLTLDEIARGCSMSVSKLKLLFREHSCSPINRFNELKIEEAKRLIRESNQNFTEISVSLGFSSLHYFSRLFKKIAGMSPSDYSETV